MLYCIAIQYFAKTYVGHGNGGRAGTEAASGGEGRHGRKDKDSNNEAEHL